MQAREGGVLGSTAKRPHDPNQLAKVIVDMAIGEEQDTR
jgi:hypothetical protein